MSAQEQSRLYQLLSTKSGLTGKSLPPETVELLEQYYGLVLKWNPILHLTTLTKPVEFVQRHFAESAFVTEHLASNAAHVFDLGSGLGVPGIPLSILRPTLPVTLVEANHRKAVFLEEVVDRLRLKQIRVQASRLEALQHLPENTVLTARAIDKMTALLPQILRLSAIASQTLLLGGEDMSNAIAQHLPKFLQLQQIQLFGSDARYLFILQRST